MRTGPRPQNHACRDVSSVASSPSWPADWCGQILHWKRGDRRDRRGRGDPGERRDRHSLLAKNFSETSADSGLSVGLFSWMARNAIWRLTTTSPDHLAQEKDQIAVRRAAMSSPPPVRRE